ncbi:helicase [Tilletia horrida]|nr:helicase [Tilletia horrida]
MSASLTPLKRPFRTPIARATHAESVLASKRPKLGSKAHDEESEDELPVQVRARSAKGKQRAQLIDDDDDDGGLFNSDDDDDVDPFEREYDALFADLDNGQDCVRTEARNPTATASQIKLGPKNTAARSAASPFISSEHSRGQSAALAKKPSGLRLGLAGVGKPRSPARIDVAVMPRKSSELEDGPFYICQWRKPQARKHKTWDGDAVLIIHKDGNTCTLRCMDTGRDLASRTRYCYSSGVGSGDQLAIAGNEVEIDREISFSVFLRGPPYDTNEPRSEAASHRSPLVPTSAKPFSAPKMLPKPKPKPIYPPTSSKPPVAREDPSFSDHGDDYDLAEVHGEPSPRDPVHVVKKPRLSKEMRRSPTKGTSTLVPLSAETMGLAAPAKTFYSTPTNSERSQSPGIRPSGLMNPGLGKEPISRFDASAPDALVMPRPSAEHQKLFNKKNLPVVDVVIDPILAKQLRPHQREGVKFLYECMMGMRGEGNATGAILADEMGLGKTLQTIALISTMLRQNCYYTSNPQTIQRALVVCPLTLVKNWKREFRKWTGSTISVMCIDGESKDNVARFAFSRTHQVLVIGYEKLRTCIDTLAQAQPPIGLIVCDEGHRLKSKQTQTTKMFEGLDTERRIILSGTPIQNDLLEFFAMFDFVVPGHLGQPNVFKAVFADPITKSRVKGATKEAVELGRARTAALTQVTHQHILRRTADILDLYLPPKLEVVIHVSPTQLQLQLYRKVLQSQMVKDVIHGDSAQHLALIAILRRLCNTPEMLLKDLVEQEGESSVTREILGDSLDLFPTPGLTYDYTLSGKLTALMRILKHVYEKTGDKVVLVSNFTTTLDILEGVLRKERYSFCRLDGKTKQKDRMDIVNDFNRQSASKSFAFLLSAKSGGVGLNLIGANRLILLDSDWNPSSDKQAMARIHRDGQKKPCYIYRMLTAGTMDEKIFLRQLSKIGLSDALMQEGGSKASSSKHASGSDSFSVEDSDDKGNADEEEDDLTGRGFMPATQHVLNEASKVNSSQRQQLATLNDWAHFDCRDSTNLDDLKDGILKSIAQQQRQATPSPPSSPPQAFGSLSNGKSQLLAALEKISQRGSATQGGHFDVETMDPGSILFAYAKSVAKVSKLSADDADQSTNSTPGPS